MKATIYRPDGTTVECEGSAEEIAELEATGAAIETDEPDAFEALVRALMNPEVTNIPGTHTVRLPLRFPLPFEVFEPVKRPHLLGPGVAGEEHTYSIGVR